MSAKKPERKVTSAADAQNQILAAVDELFYREGARAVGVEAVVQRAGVNKMSLYRQFESKDGLLLHYLARRDETFWGYVEASIAKHPGQPRRTSKRSKTSCASMPVRRSPIIFPSDRPKTAATVC